jgi:hypothetical protein
MDGSGQRDPAAGCATPARRFRGKNKNGRWKREEGTELAVIRLPLEVHRTTRPAWSSCSRACGM